ncbi:MAG: hypothetical protein ABIS92_08090 [Polyangia bacterium]
MKTNQRIGLQSSLTIVAGAIGFVAWGLPGAPVTPAEAKVPPPPQSSRLDSALRFRNAAVIAAADERQQCSLPATRPFNRLPFFFDAYVGRRSVRALTSNPAGRASNVNALDEVPDSSWFENRVGVREVSPEEVRRYPRAAGLAAPKRPFVVVGMKVGGVSPGIRIRDANGVGYLLKFDRPDDPDSETAADVVLQRLLWMVGYHTPEDTIIHFRRQDLTMDAKAKRKDLQGRSQPMTTADLEGVFAKVGRRPDGSYRGLLSRLLDGVPVGGYSQEGTRSDDPNDTVPHQERREIRGTRVFFSWLNQVDVKEDNCLDTWVEDASTPGRGHVRHQLVDFGNALGVFDWKVDESVGFANLMDAHYGVHSLVSFGLWKRPWEGRPVSKLRGVGNLDSGRFDPVGWRPQYPWVPFNRFDRFDGVWGARILMRVTPAHIEAAVAEAQYEDPRSAAYVTQTLLERQRKIGRYYLTETSALESFSVSEVAGKARVCFDDPVVAHLGAGEPLLASSTRHYVTTWDFAGRPLPFRAQEAGAARVCVDGLTAAPDANGYTIVDIATSRAGTPTNRLLLHVARDPASQALRVVGLRRL